MSKAETLPVKIEPECQFCKIIGGMKAHFRGLKKIEMSVSWDPEIPGYHHICFELTIDGMTHQEVMDDEKKYYNWMFDNIPEDFVKITVKTYCRI